MRRRRNRVAELEAELERRLQEVGYREAALSKIAAALKNRPAAVPSPPVVISGRPTLPQLEQLTAQAEREGRSEADEWAVYVGLLRNYAAADGTIPLQFDDLLRDVYGGWD